MNYSVMIQFLQLCEFITFMFMKIYIILILTFPLYLSSQYTVAVPWKNCFGINAECKTYPKDGYLVGCSNIKVKSSSDPVLVIIKKSDKVIKHAYISGSSSYDFQVPDGIYQVFFYYGDNWNSNKKMKSGECSNAYGGWEKNEFVSKDNPISLEGQIMTYTLTRVNYGNFNPKRSSLDEAL